MQEAGATGEDSPSTATAPPSSEMEIIPPPTAAPGSTADRTAYLQGKLADENGGGTSTKKSSKNAPEGAGGEPTEEFVGEEGGDAMIEMLSAFDDGDDSGDE